MLSYAWICLCLQTIMQQCAPCTDDDHASVRQDQSIPAEVMIVMIKSSVHGVLGNCQNTPSLVTTNQSLLNDA